VNTTTTSLVLGNGGARGLVHIGVIRCLQKRDYDIRYVAGSSMGALVGGIFAAGKLDIYADWVGGLQRRDILRLLDWSLDGVLFKGERIIDVLRELVGDRQIEDLPIGFTAVATDLTQRQEVWLNRGDLFGAIPASIAVPTICAPVTSGNPVLIDGEVVNPVPVAPTLNDHTDITFAVDLNGPSEPDLFPAEEETIRPTRNAYSARIGQFIERFWPNSPAPDEQRLGFSDLIIRSMETMQARITQSKLAANPPHHVLTISRNLCGFSEFHRARELIEFGYGRTDHLFSGVEHRR